MTVRQTLVCALALALTVLDCSIAEAYWLYPQMDCEIYLLHQMQDDARRMGIYAAHPGELPPLRSNAEFRIRGAADVRPTFAADRLIESRFQSEEGFWYVTVLGGYAGGGAIRSPQTDWEAKVFEGSWRPVAVYPDSPLAPHRRMPGLRRERLERTADGWFDLGHESLAYVECAASVCPVLRVGESLPEMQDDDPVVREYDPTMLSVGGDRWRSASALAMRYFRLAGDVRDVQVARLADREKDPCAAAYRKLAAKVKTSLDRLAWDEPRGLYRTDPTDTPVFGRQANVLAVVFGVAAGERARRIGEALAGDSLPPVGTPYLFGWELVALCRTGQVSAFEAGLERVFGGMLDAGATTFWEGYDAAAKGSEHYAFYGRPWGKSLCHVWSAWPAFLFVSEVMGVKPTADGWANYEVKPLSCAKGCSATVNTPRGTLTFRADSAL